MMTTPKFLRPGDRVAVVAPATEVKSEYIDGAEEYLRRRGYTPVTMPHARGPRCGTYASDDASRLSDLRAALFDPEIKAILCARGGYGCNHLLAPSVHDSQAAIHNSLLNPEDVSDNPKFLIGFSDISVLHALWLTAGVRSLHSSMAKQLTLLPDAYETELLFDILEGRTDSYTIHSEKMTAEEAALYKSLYDNASRKEAAGMIVGGNLAVLNGLASTPCDILSADRLAGKILFLEDVGEKIYQVERMLMRLYLAGSLRSAAGILFGRFTDYRPDANFPSMEAMIAARFREWGVDCPTAICMPVGHIDGNLPVVEGAEARLTVAPDGAGLEIHLPQS